MEPRHILVRWQPELLVVIGWCLLFATSGCDREAGTPQPVASESTGEKGHVPVTATGVTVHSKEWGFRAWFPGKSKETSQVVTLPDGHVTKVAMFMTERAAQAWTVVVADHRDAPWESEEDIQKRLDEGVQGAVEAVDGKLTSSKRITLNGRYSGREITVVGKPSTDRYRSRLYLVGRRLYQVVILGTEASTTSPEADAFLDSFRLIE